MRDMKLNSFDEMLADMYQVQWELGTAGFPRSHDGLEKAIKLAFDNGTCERVLRSPLMVRLFGATNLMVTSFPTTRSRIDFFS